MHWSWYLYLSSHPDPLGQWGVTTNIWWCPRIIREALLLCISSGDRYLINTKEFYILLGRWTLVHGTDGYSHIAFLQLENNNAVYYKMINHFVIMVFFGSKPVYWIPLVSSNNKTNCLMLKGKIRLRQDWNFMADVKMNPLKMQVSYQWVDELYVNKIYSFSLYWGLIRCHLGFDLWE